ncbi:MAG TPA: prenyltransferase/squalene oxidase repeat-containing protein [Thermoguttaceae bacterium]|nr:prenyltransferase/squalene oxidase repeat-containing protein [Thermoguttaceae bacterium]
MTHEGPLERPKDSSAGAAPGPIGPPAVPARRSAARPGWGSAGRSSPPSGARTTEPDDEGSREDLADQAIKTAPPWLFSAAFHMCVLILLGLYLLPSRTDSEISLEAEIYAEQLGDQLDFDSPAMGDEHDEESEPVITPKDLAEVEDPFAAPPEMETFAEGVMATSTIDAPQIGMALTGRSEGRKPGFLRDYGGTKTTEDAVLLGLKWLAKQQNKRSGAWSLTGPYRDGGSNENDAAATAMALLAFLGNGHTHQGKTVYTGNVERGLKWLLGQQDSDGCFFQGQFHSHRFYSQAQCTIVVCEALAMTKDESLRPAAKRAVAYLLDCQSELGGWRYSPRQDGDVSVTGWVVMALQSARMAGIEVPYENLQRVGRFLDSVALEEGSRYCYQNGWEATPAMTAEALLCRQYLGWPREEKRLARGVEWLTSSENLVNYQTNRNVYYWYYAAQVLHHLGGKPWERWNKVMRQEVPAHQVKRGSEAGSWDPWNQSSYDMSGGRLYVTCLSIYMLEVYYRHLPLYSGVYRR